MIALQAAFYMGMFCGLLISAVILAWIAFLVRVTPNGR